MSRLTKKIRATENNLNQIPNQSGAYLLFRGDKKPYVGSAGAGRLQKRIKEQVNQKSGVTSIRYKPTGSSAEALKTEKKYRDKYNPDQNNI